MRHKFAVLVISLFAISLPGFSQTAHRSPKSTSRTEQAHGTINIFLAADGNLVAVTDSMLTFSKTDHRPMGLKLYKLDERTICAMAGLYSDPAPLENLALFVPEIISNISQSWARRDSSHVEFAIRAADAFENFHFQMNSHLQTAFAANSALKIDRMAVELTLAGYDNDGTLKLAEMTLMPQRTNTGIRFATVDRPHSNHHLPTCWLAVTSKKQLIKPDFPPETDDFFVIFNVGNHFFCDVAGKLEVAEALLDNPNYAEGLRDPKKIPSVADLEKVGMDFEKQTADDETRHETYEVGGQAEVAVLSKGKVAEDPPSLNPPHVGQSLRASQTTGAHITCGPSGLPAVSVNGSPATMTLAPFSQLQAELIGCTQVLDGVIFHDSTFTDSTLVYLGSDGLIFADTNTIIGTTLILGPQVDPRTSTVEHLVCDFPWQAVYQNSQPVNLACPNKQS